MTLNFDNCPQVLPVSAWLKARLSEIATSQCLQLERLTALMFHFNDPGYTATDGGYHPVEIRLVRGLNGWLFDTITDFSYQGYGDWAELDKELDFDFLSPEFTHVYLGVLDHDDAIELYQQWESNFWLYCQMLSFGVAIDEH